MDFRPHPFETKKDLPFKTKHLPLRRSKPDQKVRLEVPAIGFVAKLIQVVLSVFGDNAMMNAVSVLT